MRLSLSKRSADWFPHRREHPEYTTGTLEKAIETPSGPQRDTLEGMTVGTVGLGCEEVGAETDEEIPIG